MTMSNNPDWPVLTRYDRERLTRVALPLGGIGTGTVSLGGRGDLRDWELGDRPRKGYAPPYSFFALRAEPAGGTAVTRVLEGRHEAPHESENGFRLTTYGLPRFRGCEFLAAYPFGQVLLSDRDMPVDVRLEAFNPLIPADADRSGAPVAVLRYVLINKTNKPVRATICGNVENIVGDGGGQEAIAGKANRFRDRAKSSKVSGLMLRNTNMSKDSPAHGTLALATTASSGISWRTAWPGYARNTLLHDWWRQLDEHDAMENATKGAPRFASLAVGIRVPPRGSKAVTFLLAWHFPNRRTWQPTGADDDIIGNYYATTYRDAWDVAAKTAAALPALERDTIKFVSAFCDSDLPATVKEAALYNLSTLRTQTCFRTPDGKFYGWEGCNDSHGCCGGSCTHVWNYEQATPFLFGELARSMREVEFLHATRNNGHMDFRIDLPLSRKRGTSVAAAIDGQMGCLMKLYRDWQLSGDDDMLRRLWPKARRALEFCWIEGGWDADRDGVAEGCQHTTTDFEYFGPNPVGGVWYLGALRAAEEMARRLGEDDFAETCRDLFERGRQWIDENLFNGEYYEQEIRPAKKASDIAPGLMGRLIANVEDPEYQIGDGCQSDQLVGQFMAHVCGLGFLLDKRHTRRTLRGVMKHNFIRSVHDYPSFFRAFAVNDEAGLMFGSYPKSRPRAANFRYSELWTGSEYAVAVQMLYEGLTDTGLEIIEAIRARYDGRKRSPFDEAECGHHYARAMASWGAVLALTGFRYSGVEQTMTFAAADKPTRWFWSNGDAWGTVEQRPKRGEVAVTLTVLHGELRLKRLELEGVGAATTRRRNPIAAGRTLTLSIAR